MERLKPQIRPYAWGSHEAIARLTGRQWPTAGPEAELWMGAHEAAPSVLLDTGRPLTEAIAADPDALLGPESATRFEGRLPFLLKVLAPVQALSIQAHPSVEQAAEAPAGTYADGWAKPEAFYALTDFHAFAGSRPFEEIRSTCADLGVSALDTHVAAASAAPDPGHALLTSLLRLDPHAQAELAAAVVGACTQRPGEAPAAIVSVAQHHPQDIGLVILLTMRHQVFRAGDYVFLPAGVLHAYTHGVVVEIMSNSDNVVRAGLTPKALNVEELLRIIDLETPAQIRAGQEVDGWRVFPADAPYFRLRTTRLSDRPIAVPAEGMPRVLLAIDGAAELSVGGETVRLEAGASCFLSASDRSGTVRGDATVFLAAPGL